MKGHRYRSQIAPLWHFPLLFALLESLCGSLLPTISSASLWFSCAAVRWKAGTGASQRCWAGAETPGKSTWCERHHLQQSCKVLQFKARNKITHQCSGASFCSVVALSLGIIEGQKAEAAGAVPVGLILADCAVPHWAYGDVGKCSHIFFPHPEWALASVSKAWRQWGCLRWPAFWWQFRLSDREKPEPALVLQCCCFVGRKIAIRIAFDLCQCQTRGHQPSCDIRVALPVPQEGPWVRPCWFCAGGANCECGGVRTRAYQSRGCASLTTGAPHTAAAARALCRAGASPGLS